MVIKRFMNKKLEFALSFLLGFIVSIVCQLKGCTSSATLATVVFFSLVWALGLRIINGIPKKEE